jgi:Virulence-associated protein E
VLCPREEWFSDDLPLNVDTKQIIERTGGKWIIEIPELNGFSKRDIDHLKASLSRQVDGPVRLAYGRLPTQVPRQYVPIGTTNIHRFLKDPTGNRRFWPVEIEKFDIAALRSVVDQLWAEAAQREANGESIRLDQSLWSKAAQEQEARQIDDPYDFTAPTRFDKLFTGIVIGKADRPSFIPEGDRTGTEGIGPEDTGEAEYERLLEAAQNSTRKYWRARRGSNPRPTASKAGALSN